MVGKFRFLICFCLFGGCFFLPFAHAENWDAVSAQIGEKDAIAVAAPDGGMLFGKNEHAALVPASALKVLTALVALESFGPAYRFPTEFYLDAEHNLIIKGYGDPLLVSEQVQAICKTLSEKIGTVNDLIMDASYFDSATCVPGTRNQSLQPYDAPIGALCVNFNTIYFRKENGRYISAEPQTPLLPTARKRLGAQAIEQGRILLSPDRSELTQYAGELFMYFLVASGVKVNGAIRHGLLDPADCRLIYRHFGEATLAETVTGLLKYSNNFIANQLLLATGAHVYGPPATLEKGRDALKRYAGDRLGIAPKLAEGSGISRDNRVSAAMFLKILDAFAPYRQLMQDYDGIRYKTGTLSGIQTRVGYIPSKNGKVYRFAVLINTPGKLADPIVREVRKRIESMK